MAEAPRAREFIIELEHEIADLNKHIVYQSRALREFDSFKAQRRTALLVGATFAVVLLLGLEIHPPQQLRIDITSPFKGGCTISCENTRVNNDRMI